MNEDLSNKLPVEMAPPDELEERVVDALYDRRLLRRESPPVRPQQAGWRMMRYALATAAALALVAFGVLLGRATLETAPGGTLTGAEDNLYALLLYETPGYDRPGAAEARLRYDEYSQWVGEAYAREQFVTGEDLEVDRGWRVTPGTGAIPIIEPTGAQAPAAPLSGIFFIRANDPDEALDLALTLPHLRHGGEVIVQKTIPTVTPPP